MKFEEITEKEYIDFWNNSDQKNFLSSAEISKSKETGGWKCHYLGVKKDGILVACSILLSIRRHFGKYEFKSPRGLLVDYNDDEVLNFFVRELKKYIKKNNGYELKISPYVIYKQRDINGDIVEGGIDNSNIRKKLLKMGFKRTEDMKSEQVIWMFSLDLKGKTEDEILSEMKPNTRSHIKKSLKNNITIKELSYDELDRFYNILMETGERKSFKIRELGYFQSMYKLLHDKDEVKFLVTELNLNDYIKSLENEIDEFNKSISNLENTKKIKELNDLINANKEKIENAKTILDEEKKDTITLSGSMFIMMKPEVVYLASGNYEKFMFFNSQYLIQWEMIKYAINHGFDKYNFYGIPAEINTKPKDYGIYEFKRGFNGYVEQLIGEYTLPISMFYYIFKIISKIKR